MDVKSEQGSRGVDDTFEQQLHGPGSSVPSRFAIPDSGSFRLVGGDEVAAGGRSDDIKGEVVMFGLRGEDNLVVNDAFLNNAIENVQQSALYEVNSIKHAVEISSVVG